MATETRPYQILLAEDSAADVGIVRIALRDQNLDHVLHVARDGEEAILPFARFAFTEWRQSWEGRQAESTRFYAMACCPEAAACSSREVRTKARLGKTWFQIGRASWRERE